MKTLSAILLSAALAPAELHTYRIAPAENRLVELRVYKTGLLRGKKHRFTFDKYAGTVEVDSADPANSRVTLSIEAGSIVCRDEWVSAKDLTKIRKFAYREMLAAERFPRIEFTSTSIEPLSKDEYRVTGMLAIRDLSRPVEATVRMKVAEGGAALFDGTGRIRMSAWGLKPPSAALGTIGTKDEMDLFFSLTAQRNNRQGK